MTVRQINLIKNINYNIARIIRFMEIKRETYTMKSLYMRICIFIFQGLVPHDRDNEDAPRRLV